MYELKKIGKVFTSKFVGTGPSSYKKIIYCAAVSQRLRITGLGLPSGFFPSNWHKTLFGPLSVPHILHVPSISLFLIW